MQFVSCRLARRSVNCQLPVGATECELSALPAGGPKASLVLSSAVDQEGSDLSMSSQWLFLLPCSDVIGMSSAAHKKV